MGAAHRAREDAPNVTITHRHTPLAAVVVKHQKGMSRRGASPPTVPTLAPKAWFASTPEDFPSRRLSGNLKDNHFGMGLSATHIGIAARRDRLLLLAAVAHALLSMLGAAGEACGMARVLQANTSKNRQLSLFRQGCMWYRAIPTMGDERLRVLMAAFAEVMLAHAAFNDIFGII